MGVLSGLMKAIVDAIHGQDEQIAGQRVTNLRTGLNDTDTEVNVVSTIGFGEDTDGTGDAKLIIDGEIIYASGRNDTQFTGLTRGVDNTKIKERYPQGELVTDWARNTSALDIVRRGFLVRYAIGPDLDVIGRNLGLKKCPGWSDALWREFIEEIAYAPKQIIPTFYEALDIILGPGNYEIVERLVSEPYMIYVYVDGVLADSLRGRFYLNGGEQQLSTGLLQVQTDYAIIDSPLDPGPGSVGVFGVYDDVPLARRGIREGLTNYFTGGSFVGNVITLGSSPGPVGTPLLVDYNAFPAHYLPDPFTVIDDEDHYPYFFDPFLGVRCLVDQIRAAGIKVELRNMITP
jgi:hypothetical protein